MFKKTWPILRVKLNLNKSKTVKVIQTSFLPGIPFAIVCTMKKTRGLYHVCERRYLNFSCRNFLEILDIHTAPTEVTPTEHTWTKKARQPPTPLPL